MLQKSRELKYAAAAMLFITLAYLVVQARLKEVPAASSLWGHSIGVLGFVLMLMTEVLYSLRKRSAHAKWGRMADWLEFHIFTGLVGPFLVLLHPGFQFKGLAGVLSLLTILIVISGFIGRYIYTAVPRTADGVEIDLAVLEAQAAAIEAELKVLSPQQITQPIAARRAMGAANTAGGGAAYQFTDVLQPHLINQAVSGAMRAKKRHLHDLQLQQRKLQKVIRQRQTARRLFALWHTIHIPLGLTLFLIAFIHIGAAIYYALLLK
jgi:Na+-transporting methylmalonyl-CoA/oxaloacetate decarboxylase gamma subunit